MVVEQANVPYCLVCDSQSSIHKFLSDNPSYHRVSGIYQIRDPIPVVPVTPGQEEVIDAQAELFRKAVERDHD